MYIQHGKLLKKPVTLENDIDLLSKFPMGGLMGGEVLKNYGPITKIKAEFALS
jgi:hypothetical protein